MNKQNMRNFLLLILSFPLVLQLQAQRASGTWQDYLSYKNATKIAVASDKVYCLTEGGALYYDTEDNSVSKLSEVVGLSDVGISTIAYNDGDKILVIAYDNCNIDLLNGEGGVVNLSDIYRKQFTGDKTINNISFADNEAYLACGFGIVAVNLDKNEIIGTYIIGEGGAQLNVNDVAIFNDTIYAATDNGILKAGTEDNLLDYNNWLAEEKIPNPSGKFNFLETHAGKLIANYTPGEWYSDALYSFDGSGWVPYHPSIKYAFDIQECNGYLAITSRGSIYIIDSNNDIAGKINSYGFDDGAVNSINAQSSGITSDGKIWIADAGYSLVIVAGDEYEDVQVNGPMDNNVFTLAHTGTNLWVAPGDKSGWESPRFQRFGNGQWDYFSSPDHSELDGFYNIISVAVDPSDENHIFIGSWGGGLLEYKDDEFIERYTNKNSPLETALPTQPDEPYVWVDGMAFDSEGNLWVSNSVASYNLHKLSPDGNWESVELPETSNDCKIGQVIVTENDDKWVVVDGDNLYVVNSDGSDKLYLPVISYFSNGENTITNEMSDVQCIVEDNDGEIWLGTTEGVAVFSNPSQVWNTETYYATQPSLELGDGLYNPLLETESITAIAVDGANRKWIGTENSGVYLVSENGDEEIEHFTKDNSALLSNTITDIAIDQTTGEVFFGTEEGLISYQGDATGGNDKYKDVYVYPNPVRETYDGTITITGLVTNTDIKITDITGNLVYHTTSLGGNATWDGKNLNGNRVKTGVYLVFCNDGYGNETHIAKLLFIH